MYKDEIMTQGRVLICNAHLFPALSVGAKVEIQTLLRDR